jgi:DNA modification methylase
MPPRATREKSFFRKLIDLASMWDDLWVAYAVASLELETQTLKGQSNVALLDEKLSAHSLHFDYSSLEALHASVTHLAQTLTPLWTEDSLPVKAPADQWLYIRDLLYLRAIYETTRPVSKKKAPHPPELTHHPLRESPLPYQLALIQPTKPTPRGYTPEPISFRDLVPEITETGYLTHALYYYPAKFIPHVVRYCLREYTQPGDWVIDPFAGSGTTGVEAALTERNAVLLDLNPLLEHIRLLKFKPYSPTQLETISLHSALDAVRRSPIAFRPDWSNLEYWYPAEMLEVVCHYWGGQRALPDTPEKLIIEAALLKISKHFSYAEHKTPKLFISKTKRQYITELLQQNWRAQLEAMVYDTAHDIGRRVREFARVAHGIPTEILTYGGVDSAKFQLSPARPVNCLISSPPYLQAQEYIRTAKLDLFWLGHSESEIKRLSKLEIPYRKADQIIETPTLQNVRQACSRPDLVALLDAYFCYTLEALENASQSVNPGGSICIFVGSPKIDGVEVETWRIFAEYFTERGFTFKHVYEDRIKHRQLFGRRKNKNPEGMKSEFLLVLSKRP